MRPVQRAAAVYEQETCPRSFREDLEAHLLYGIVVSNDQLFLMARPVRQDATYERICNPWVSFQNPDCWHLYLYSGHLKEAFDSAPYPLPFVSFERKNKLRIYSWVRIHTQCMSL